VGEESDKYGAEKDGGRCYEEGKDDTKGDGDTKEWPSQVFALLGFAFDELERKWKVGIEIDTADRVVLARREIGSFAN
jgi:hypothetical protein